MQVTQEIKDKVIYLREEGHTYFFIAESLGLRTKEVRHIFENKPPKDSDMFDVDLYKDWVIGNTDRFEI